LLIEILWYVSLMDESCHIRVSYDTLLGTCVRERERGCVCACAWESGSAYPVFLDVIGSCHTRGWVVSHMNGSCQAVGRAIFFRFSFLRQGRFFVLFCWSAYAHTLSLSLSLSLTHTRAHTHTHTLNPVALSLWPSLLLFYTRARTYFLFVFLSLCLVFSYCAHCLRSLARALPLSHTHIHKQDFMLSVELASQYQHVAFLCYNKIETSKSRLNGVRVRACVCACVCVCVSVDIFWCGCLLQNRYICITL